jgi:hypothetical protein
MEMRALRVGEAPAESRRHGRKPYRIPLKTRHQPGWGFHPLKWRAAPSRQPGLAAPQSGQAKGCPTPAVCCWRPIPV